MKSLQLEKPHAIVVIGIQGSGKTFFAQKFADTFNAPFVEQSSFDALAVDQAASDTLMQHMLKELVKTGRSIVVELALPTRNERNELSKFLRQSGYVPMFVWVQVDVDTALTRTRKLAKAGANDYHENMRRFSLPHPSERALVVSGKHTFATQAKVVLRKLSAPRQHQAVQQSAPQQPARGDRPQAPQPPQRGQIIVR